MEITEVRIKLMESSQERLQAFCSITIDGCFVVRDLKIIQGTKGSFVAMPSRKLTDRCPKCHTKNHLRAQHCNQCGLKLNEERAVKDSDGRAKLYADIAHPISSLCRDAIQTAVIEAYEQELVLSQSPGYECKYDDYGENDFATTDESYTDSPMPVVTVSKPETGTRRFEPGTNGHPQPPHHVERSKATKQTSSPPRNETADEADAFGAGIL